MESEATFIEEVKILVDNKSTHDVYPFFIALTVKCYKKDEEGRKIIDLLSSSSHINVNKILYWYDNIKVDVI